MSNYELRIRKTACFLIAGCMALMLSCGDDEKPPVEIPAYVLSKEKMAAVLTDIHIAEAEINLKTLPDSSSTQKPVFDPIYRKYQVSRTQCDTSLSFYVHNPELLNEVYEIVLNELSKKQAASKQ